MKHADHWFFVPNSSTNLVTFPQEEATHAAKVLRLTEGDGIQWLNGKGGRFKGQVISIQKHSLVARIESSSIVKAPIPTILAVGQLHDASRMEWLVEKATELGVSELVLVSTSRVERTRYKIPRLEAKVIAAVKQSGRAWVPAIRELGFAEALTAFSDTEHKFIAHCYQDLKRTDTFSHIDCEHGACLFIGPEGDFTKKEIILAEDAGFESIALGQARLRTETAAIAAIVKLRALLA